ncbi:MAG: lytic murein transglycosylase [Burkholderiaceae bacterium]
MSARMDVAVGRKRAGAVSGQTGHASQRRGAGIAPLQTEGVHRAWVAGVLLAMGAVAMPAHAQTAAGAAPAPNMPTLASCLATLRPAAPANGVSVADFDRYTQDASLLVSTVSSARGQPEGRETWWDYIAKTVDEERVSQGRDIQNQYANELTRVAQQYRVDPEVLVAIFGIETNYGKQIGKTRVLDAWLTRGCTESNPLWKKNVYASIRLLRDGTVQPDTFVGSWSGAFGMTQFIPTSFYELAADGDGDGKIDLYNSLPDALASTANHLLKRRAKWTHGLPAIVEVSLPAGIKSSLPADPMTEVSASETRLTAAAWAERGVRRPGGEPIVSSATGLQSDTSAYLFAPTGATGPVFLVTPNFDAILHYNQSKKYGLAVGLLVERLRGHPGIRTAWPTDDPGLSRAQVREVQTRLIDKGYDIGTPDGIPGAKTRMAVQEEQRRAGLPENGRVGRKIYDLLHRP